MEDQDPEIIREFLVESYENLSRLDQEFVELEQRPQDKELLASIFRTIHTIKGTCGFLGFSVLENVAHQAENILSRLRDGLQEPSPAIVTLILETVDVIRRILHSIEAGAGEGSEQFADLTARLRSAIQNAPREKQPSANTPPEPEPASAPGVLHDGKPAGKAPQQDQAARSSSVSETNIRVSVGLLDKLMDLVGELVLTRNQILQYNSQCEDPTLNASSQKLNLITTELQEGVMKTRMQPIGTVWNKLPRIVRDTALALGKQVRVEMDGADTELDRTIIEAIKDPLVHLVRNACDHGVESPDVRARLGKPPQGTLSLRAYHEGGQVNIEISDDGAGVDIAKVKKKAVEKGVIRPDQAEHLTEREELALIFRPGFSTVEKVTNLSGRGVGMDVVRSHIEHIGGVVDLFSRPGQGTTFKLKIPLTLAIIPGLVVTSGGERFVIPQVSLLELIRLDRDSKDKQIESVHGARVYRRRGALLPVADLNQVLGLESPAPGEAVNLVVLQAEDRQFGLVVDGISDTQEIVVKPLGKQLKGLTVYAGATIMGDGRVALILDVLGIGESSGVLAQLREPSRAAAAQDTRTAQEQQRLLLFRAGSLRRLALPLSMVARLEVFPRASIEHAAGSEVIQYRGNILSLIPLARILDAEPGGAALSDEVQVIVFGDGDRSLGLIVDQILDVVEDSVVIRQKTSRKGLLGSGVVGRQVADFLDLAFVIRAATSDWFRDSSGNAQGLHVLLAEKSAFSRGLIRSRLDLSGYRVVEASNLEEAIKHLEHASIDIVLASLNLPPSGTSFLLSEMRGRPEWEKIPILTLADSVEQRQEQNAAQTADVSCEMIFDHDAVLESIIRLGSALTTKTSSLCTKGRVTHGH